MKPLIVLIAVFTIGILINALVHEKAFKISLIGRLAMSSMLLFTGISHFAFTEGMTATIPESVPYPEFIIWVTGLLEILGALGLISRSYYRLTGKLLILFFILILPANIYAAIHHINPITGLSNGHGPGYLLMRIPLQCFFITWVYGFTLFRFKKPDQMNSPKTIIKLFIMALIFISTIIHPSSCIARDGKIQQTKIDVYSMVMIKEEFNHLINQ